MPNGAFGRFRRVRAEVPRHPANKDSHDPRIWPFGAISRELTGRESSPQMLWLPASAVFKLFLSRFLHVPGARHGFALNLRETERHLV
jgi:hypothetical protein